MPQWRHSMVSRSMPEHRRAFLRRASLGRVTQREGPPSWTAPPCFEPRARLPLADLPWSHLPDAGREVDVVGEDVLVVGDAVRGRERVDVPRVGPDRVPVVALVDDEAAVVAD